IITEPLVHIFNFSLDTGIVPDDWKTAKITPVHKEGDKNDPTNYRPISVINVCMKVFERCIHDQLSFYLTKHNVLSPYQSGFRHMHATTTTVIN
ncbi:reverse transcriptase domain-containing protein, partial [Acinetobacter baumannii]|uniref:reverse transcriptase domain-containing protein n=1 Tax=Acinetobacter baumannii TaxID=470 RepID=UPI00148F1FAC